MLAGYSCANTEISSPDWGLLCHGSLDAVVDAIAHVHIKPPWLTKQGFVARRAAAMPVAGGLALAIRLRFHNHAPQEFATCFVFHQQAADQLRCHLFCGAAEERSWQRGEVLDGRGDYGSGLESKGKSLGNPSHTCLQAASSNYNSSKGES